MPLDPAPYGFILAIGLFHVGLDVSDRAIRYGRSSPCYWGIRGIGCGPFYQSGDEDGRIQGVTVGRRRDEIGRMFRTDLPPPMPRFKEETRRVTLIEFDSNRSGNHKICVMNQSWATASVKRESLSERGNRLHQGMLTLREPVIGGPYVRNEMSRGLFLAHPLPPPK